MTVWLLGVVKAQSHFADFESAATPLTPQRLEARFFERVEDVQNRALFVVYEELEQ